MFLQLVHSSLPSLHQSSSLFASSIAQPSLCQHSSASSFLEEHTRFFAAASFSAFAFSSASAILLSQS
jgi:hypothetical protein